MPLFLLRKESGMKREIQPKLRENLASPGINRRQNIEDIQRFRIFFERAQIKEKNYDNYGPRQNGVVYIAVGQWLVSGLQWSSSARQSLAARQKVLSE